MSTMLQSNVIFSEIFILVLVNVLSYNDFPGQNLIRVKEQCWSSYVIKKQLRGKYGTVKSRESYL